MLLRWFLSVFLNAVALMVVTQIFPESFIIEGFGTAMLASVILSILNVFVKPILILFTLPITFITLGFFLFVVNAITLMITQGVMDSSFVINSFGIAIIASIIISVLNTLLHSLVKDTVR